MRKAGPWILSFFLLVLGSAAFAQQDRLIMVTETWPPYRIPDPASPRGFTGIDIDVLQRLEQRLGLQIEVQRHPFARCLQMIRSGQADLITGIAYTEERARYIRYVPTPYSEVQPVFYARAGQGARVKRYQDLYDYRIGYSLNSAYFEPFNSDSALNKVGVSTEQQLVRMLALGRLELIIGTNPNLAYDVKRFGFSGKLEATAYIPEPKTPLYFGLSAAAAATGLLEQIDSFLEELVSSSEMESIADRYR